jgi:hypothetical protein
VVFFFSVFFGHRNPFVSIKNQIETTIAMMQTQIETMARALTMSSGSKWLLLLKNPYLFPIRNAGRLSKCTINAINYLIP